jgi:hypothetical protein
VDHRLKDKSSNDRSESMRETARDASPSLPPRTEAQFLGQLPELAEALLELSEDYESALLGLHRTLKTADFMRGWGVLETLARESLMERARAAAEKRAQEAREHAVLQAQTAKPSIPRRTIESAIKSQAMKALNDPGVLNALKQWTHTRGSSKS